MNRKLTFNIVALLCSIWFVLLSWAWVYLFNVIFVFPVGILGFVLWRLGRDSEYRVVSRVTAVLLAIGVVTSITAILMFK
jgi:hypothetical protein